MDYLVIVSILGAAFLHAFWNFMVRSSTDKAVGMAAVMIGHLPLSFMALLFMGLPPIESGPYILLSALLHACYSVFLLNAYRFGELSDIYPIARGASSILITLGSILFLPDNLAITEIVGVLMISGSVLTYGIAQCRDNSLRRMGVVLALATSCFIAAYTVVDGTGVRIAKNAMVYFGLMSVCNSMFLVAYFNYFHHGVIRRVFTEEWRTCLIGGSASFIAYAIVLWAFLSTPIPLVSALREISVLFAVGLGVVLLRERLTISKILFALAIFVGVAMVRFG